MVDNSEVQVYLLKYLLNPSHTSAIWSTSWIILSAPLAAIAIMLQVRLEQKLAHVDGYSRQTVHRPSACKHAMYANEGGQSGESLPADAIGWGVQRAVMWD